jgi:prepilin-type N-terminal cleavage/methylation domain-containing protein
MDESRRGDDGFSLIELLVVVLVLSVLAAIVILSIGRTSSDAQGSVCRNGLSAIVEATEAYHTKTGTFPADAAALLDPTVSGLLGRWPGGTDSTKDPLVFTYARDASHDYAVSLSGLSLTPPRVLYGDAASDRDVALACR